MKSQVSFEYLYRDADNYKNHGEIVFDNPKQRSLASIESKIKEMLIDGVWFVAHQVELPELFHYKDSHVTDADHCYHEFVGIRYSPSESEQEAPESIEDLLARCQTESTAGWKAFDPYSRI